MRAMTVMTADKIHRMERAANTRLPHSPRLATMFFTHAVMPPMADLGFRSESTVKMRKLRPPE